LPSERLDDPNLRRKPRHSFGRSVEPAFQPKVSSNVGVGLDVVTVNSERRRTEKPLGFSSVGGLHATELDLLLNPLSLQYRAKLR